MMTSGVHPRTETQKIGTPYSEWRCSLKGRSKRERRTAEFKKKTVRRMLAGEPVSRLSRELKVERSQLYRWRDAYRKEGAAGSARSGAQDGTWRTRRKGRNRASVNWSARLGSRQW